MADYQLTQTGPEVQEVLNSVGPNTAAIEAEVARAEAAEHELNESIIDESEARADADAALAREIAADKENLAENYFNKEQVTNLIIPQDVDPVVVDALPEEGEPGKVYRVPGTDSYSDYAWDGTEWVPLATHNIDAIWPQIGYYECATAAATAAKTVAAPGYVLATGGNVRIKMTYANTAANVTLNINSTGAKALYYDGAQASSSNSWDAGDVLTIYYDGTQYQVQVSAGTAAKVKYDNTTSELEAVTVQDAIDEVCNDIEENAVSEATMQQVVGQQLVKLADAYSTNNVLWNGTINVGQTFGEAIVENQSGCVIYKIAVTAGQVVKFNVKPSGYGNYGKVLLTDSALVVKSKIDRDSITVGTTLTVEVDGYVYVNSTNSVANPFNIQDVVHYLSNKKLTEMAGKAEAAAVSFEKERTGLFNDNVQQVIEEIIGSEIDVDYTFAGTGRFNADGTINANGAYKYTKPIPLKAGVAISVTTYVAAQYGFIALTNAAGTSYTVVATNTSADGSCSAIYKAESDSYVSVALYVDFASNKVAYQYPFPVLAERVPYDNEGNDIIISKNVQGAIDDLYHALAGGYTFPFNDAGVGFIQTDGTVYGNGYFRYSNPIHLMQGDEITVTTWCANSYFVVIALTDADASYYTPVLSDSSSTTKTYTYTAPSECYIAVSHAATTTTYSMKYIKRFLYDSLSAYDSQITKDGGKFVVLGDSITADPNSWVKYVANHYSIPAVNLAVAGSTWHSEQPFVVDLSGNFDNSHTVNNLENQVYRLLQKITPAGEVVPELTADMTYAEGYSYPILGTGEIDPDEVTLLGISEGGNDVFGGYVAGDLDATCSNPDFRALDRSTLYGVMRWACVLLQYYLPNANIFLMTPIPTGRSTTSFALGIGAQIKDMAYRLGVNVIDMQYCGISSNVAGLTIVPDTNNRSRYFNDGLHPNAFGQKLMGRYAASMLDCWWKY